MEKNCTKTTLAELAHNVQMTLPRRQCDVMISQNTTSRRPAVVITSFLRSAPGVRLNNVHKTELIKHKELHGRGIKY